MGIIRSILCFILGVLFPVTLLYKPLNGEVTNENTEMPPERTRTAESYGTSDTLPQARRRPGRIGQQDGAAETANRKSWYQKGTSLLNWKLPLPDLVVRGKQREQRGEGRAPPQVGIRKDALRHMPSRNPEEARRIGCDDQSRRLFQDTLDICSEADAIKACRALNNKINNAALTLVDEWAQSPSLSQNRGRSSTTSGSDSNLRTVIGQKLYYLIKGTRSAPPSDEVQDWVINALQASAVHHISIITSTTFCPGLSFEADAQMNDAFRSMLRSELTAAALRWRALTYTHCTRHRKAEENVKKFTTKFERYIADCFKSIFILAGEKTSSAFLAGIEEAVKENEIVRSALDLSELIKTKFFSVNLDVYIIGPGAELREDDVGIETDATKGMSKTVLCTLEIGLREVSSQAGHGRFLMKPKVVLSP